MPYIDWLGKDDVVHHHKEIPYKTINCQEVVGEADSDNLIIKGDNLLALKSLLPYYANAVKMIYIDPPYNTGNTSWVYNDNMDSPLIKKWLNNLVDSDDLSRSDKWLCMMYPRLKLLRELLKEDGIIFISIDDAEIAHLRMICDEIFGKKNFIAQLIWHSEGNTDNQFEVKIKHEYILVYIKNSFYKSMAIGNIIDPNTREDSNLWKGIADNNINKNNPANPPSIVELPIGFPCVEEDLYYKAHSIDDDFFGITAEEKMISNEIKNTYNIENISGLPVKLDDMEIKNYMLSKPCRIYGGLANKNKLLKFIDNNCKPIEDGDDILRFYLNQNAAIRYHKEKKESRNIISVLENFGTTEKMKTTLAGMGIKFSYPKPVELIEYLVKIGVGNETNAIILDSFAGSGTTANAVLNLNNEKIHQNKFILIEMEEYAEKLTKARVKKNILGYKNKKNKTISGLGSGFKYCELGKEIFDETGELNAKLSFDDIAKHIYFVEFKQPRNKGTSEAPYVGSYKSQHLYFYEKQFKVAQMKALVKMHEKYKQIIVYTRRCSISLDELKKHKIVIRYIPYDIKDN